MRPFLRWSTVSAFSLFALAVGCSDDSDRDGPHEPEEPGLYLTGNVAANPHNTISAVVTAKAVRYDSASIRYWKGAEIPALTPAVTFNADSTAVIPVLGLDTASSYSLELQLWTDSEAETPDTFAFTTGSLPAWIPEFGVAGTDTTPGYLLVSFPDGAVIVNNDAKVLWYRFRPGGVLGSWQAFHGGYSWLANTDSSGFYIHDILGNETGRVSCKNDYKTRFHDILMLPAGDTWIMCDELRTMDLSAEGGDPAAQVVSTVVQHLSPTGQVLFEWKALDHFAITDVPLSARNGLNVNFTHGNAIALDTDGNLLLSWRTLNEVTKINSTTGEVMWRFGGLANQFTLVDDPKGSFTRQHGVRSAGLNTIQFLDNADAAPSRVVRYRMDPVAHTATMQLEFHDLPTTFAGVGGSTQVYPDGSGLVTFGPAGRVMEFSPEGEERFALTGLEGVYVFRIERIPSLYAPEGRVR